MLPKHLCLVVACCALWVTSACSSSSHGDPSSFPSPYAGGGGLDACPEGTYLVGQSCVTGADDAQGRDEDGGTELHDGGTGSPDGSEHGSDVSCTAPLPTGFCFVSQPGDYIGGGGSGTLGPAGISVSGSTSLVHVDVGNYEWSLDFAAVTGLTLHVGPHTQAQRYPFQDVGHPGLDVSGHGSGCNMLSGRFDITELETRPGLGIVRFAASFEQHCEDAKPALFGVIHYNATGHDDAPLTVAKSIALSGKISRLTYDPVAHVAYGLDATNRKIAVIDLATQTASYHSVVQVPNDACVDHARNRLFVVNKGSTLITEHSLDDFSVVRQIPWSGTDRTTDMTHFHIYCSKDVLYVVDGAWSPGLSTVEELDDAEPVVTDRTSQVSGVGGLVLNAAATDLYYWEQVGWDAGNLSTSVRRLATDTLTTLDQTMLDYQQFSRDPVDAPVLLDESRGLVFSKNHVFDATNLAKVVYTLPGEVGTVNGAAENVYALDAERGLMASRDYVYGLDTYDVLAATLYSDAEQMFFDRDGLLWFLSTTRGTLEAQAIAP